MDIQPGPSEDSLPFRVPLPSTFQYTSEPLEDSNTIPMLGHHTDVAADICNRLRHSNGGALLVAGFRGVGKTTVVRRAIKSLSEDPDEFVVDVSLNVAKPLSTTELVYSFVRQLVERLLETGILEELDPQTRERVVTAYMRTSMKMSRSASQETESGLSIALPGPSKPVVASLKSPIPTIGWTRRQSRSLAVQTSFLGYADSDAEHDFLRIVTALKSHRRKAARPTWLPRFARRRNQPLRIIFVLDELDKLAGTEEGTKALDDIFFSLKNILTGAGAHFVFVGGPELYDRVEQDDVRGVGLYDSVFSWSTYVPCTWDGAQSLLKVMVRDLDSEATRLLNGFLAYRSRGLPRRLIQALNELTQWENGSPVLCLDGIDRTRVHLLSRFDEVIGHHLALDVDLSDRTSLSEDRRRLAAYLTMEWVASSAGRVFELADIAADIRGYDISSGTFPLRPEQVRALLHHLASASLVEARAGNLPTKTFFVKPGDEPSLDSFALADDVLAAMRSISGLPPWRLPTGRPFAGSRPAEATLTGRPARDEDITGLAADRSGSIPGDWTIVGRAPRTDGGGASSLWDESQLAAELQERYEMRDPIARGATGMVYHAVDSYDGSSVAIKVIETLRARSDSRVRMRLEREIVEGMRLQHPGIVRVRGPVLGPEAEPIGVIMDFVEGLTLAEITWPVSEDVAVLWGIKICDALDYLVSKSLARVDLKPSNIIIERSTDSPVIIDLGTLTGPDDRYARITQDGDFVGTPAYMAPEQFASIDVDIRADIYSLGLVLFEILGGSSLRQDATSVAEAARRNSETDVPVWDLDVTVELREALSKAVTRSRNERYPRPVDFAADLRGLSGMRAP